MTDRRQELVCKLAGEITFRGLVRPSLSRSNVPGFAATPQKIYLSLASFVGLDRTGREIREVMVDEAVGVFWSAAAWRRFRFLLCAW